MYKKLFLNSICLIAIWSFSTLNIPLSLNALDMLSKVSAEQKHLSPRLSLQEASFGESFDTGYRKQSADEKAEWEVENYLQMVDDKKTNRRKNADLEQRLNAQRQEIDDELKIEMITATAAKRQKMKLDKISIEQKDELSALQTELNAPTQKLLAAKQKLAQLFVQLENQKHATPQKNNKETVLNEIYKILTIHSGKIEPIYNKKVESESILPASGTLIFQNNQPYGFENKLLLSVGGSLFRTVIQEGNHNVRLGEIIQIDDFSGMYQTKINLPEAKPIVRFNSFSTESLLIPQQTITPYLAIEISI
ncbi:MAG: hypothetical protein DRP78_00225 [Candidatus Omnitrophota bacterium]|nr:MAG: hypothetical protein DRP78_00225 [Candidatus Omnitrophota bacterium]